MECPLAEELFHCTCQIADIEDDSTKKFSGWEGRPVTSHSTHNTASLHNTPNAPSATSTSGISHTHHSTTSNNSGKSNSKHHVAKIATAFQEAPDIPFNMSEVHSTPHLRELDNHSAHVEHYLSLYTYPHLQHMLLASLPTDMTMLCSCCSEAAARSSNHLNGGREGLVRPSVVQVLLKDSVHKLRSTRHLSLPQAQESAHTLGGVHSTPSAGLHLGPSSSSSLNTFSNTDTCTFSTALVPLPRWRKHRNANCSDSIQSKCETKRKTSDSYETARHVYDMGVRWNPNSFPSFIVSSANTRLKHKLPPAIGRTANTKKKANSNTSPTLNSGSKNAKNSAQLLHAPPHVRGRKGRIRESLQQGSEKPAMKPATKNPSTFSITTPSHQSLNPAQSSGKMPPIRPQNMQGLLATRRDLKHLLRHKKSVSFRSGKASGFRYESLCLEGCSATTKGGEVGESDYECSSDSTTANLSSGGSRPPVKIAGTWIN